MADVFATNWVLSSWPFRLGSVLYDPILRMDVAAWDLEGLAAHPDLTSVPLAALDPRRAYRQRSREVVQTMQEDQELLRALYDLDPSSPTEVRPQVSTLIADELNAWLEPYQLSWEDLQLERLDELLARLEALPEAEHHRFLADWWETWEIPERSEPSRFRTEAGPGGALYAPVYGEQALQAWQQEVASATLSDFSLWSALRAHWGWRLEFPDQPRPQWPVLARLHALFG